MENFVVSARKYRPQTFDTVVGQSAITSTLRNAIENNHLGQAFLFCGPRGVGKTSCARILAREINKHAAKKKGEDENADFSLNILELDAASNNSVDDIRNLTDQVRFAPQVGSFKVYIIDEVHMLSLQAFNAFLKTLEEPPPHAIFILATTEKHKILPTILSRCQIFDFQRITVGDIAQHLAGIAEQEGVQADTEALTIIAEKADGAMRDALSMFDQLVSFSGNSLTYESVIENLNVLDYDYYFRMVEHISAHLIPASILVYDEIQNKGFDGHHFIIGLAQHLRNLMMCKSPKTLNLIETSDAVKQRYQEQSESLSIRFIFKALEILNDSDVNYKSSKNQRLLVEFALMRLCAITEKKSESAPKPIVTPTKSADKAKLDTINSEVSPETGAQINPVAADRPPAMPTPAPVTAEQPKPTEYYSTPPIPDDKAKEEKPEIIEPAVNYENAARRKKFLTKFQTASVSIAAGLNEDEDHLTETETAETSNSTESRPQEAFDQEKLMEVWQAYARNVKKTGRESLYSTLTLSKPEIHKDFRLLLLIKNSTQALDLNKEKPDMLDFLREQLNNYYVEIDFEIEVSDQPTALYTNSQKFEAMVKKNPNLGKLTGNLNLDIY